MGKFIDMAGQKFGRLTVIKRVYPSSNNGNAMWLCKCECGTKKIINGRGLKTSDTRSCGCLHKELFTNRLSLGLSNMRYLMRAYKNSAEKRGYEFKLTEKQFSELTKRNCYYCGTKPNNIAKQGKRYGKYVYNGIDRIDNNKGYTIDNVVSCCKICNYAKRKLTLQEFKEWVKRVYMNYIIEKK